MKVFEKSDVVKYLKKRQLEKPYFQAKQFLEKGLYELVDLRKRQPKHHNLFYFKINRQYRAVGYINRKQELIVTEILDHQ